ncbi:reactive oxygen species modulator 1 isoform X3 [Canna indica]|uniref:Reactive oxygen species modulator 1 isoform X3 n=1 Tax=Canna indica TaxID=4628 RepID=A0AAQ3K111_9LILI|nr:reactive oxygen species modulator 1 isoform X3 [Canna indica]
MGMSRDSCLARVTAGVAIGGAVGGAVGAVYGTYEAIRYRISLTCSKALDLLVFSYVWICLWNENSYVKQVPGLLKIRHIGQTTLGSAAVFGLFLGAGSLIHCGKSY